jgi:hypothetical protein
VEEFSYFGVGGEEGRGDAQNDYGEDYDGEVDLGKASDEEEDEIFDEVEAGHDDGDDEEAFHWMNESEIRSVIGTPRASESLETVEMEGSGLLLLSMREMALRETPDSFERSSIVHPNSSLDFLIWSPSTGLFISLLFLSVNRY